MKKNILLSAAAALLIGSTSLYATSNKELKAIEHADVPIHHFWAFGEAPDHLNKQQLEYLKSVGLLKKHAMLTKEVKKLVHKQSEASKEATAGLVETLKAIANLEKKNTKAAQKHLKTASELFEKAIKKEPSLKLIPVDEDVSLVEHTITLDDAKKIKKTAIKLLEENRPQETIDQITVTTTFIPMDLYPAATKKAYEALKKGKKPEIALETLAAALDTIVTVEVVVPIPVLVAQNAVHDASKLPKSKKKEIQALLDIAQNQLDLAQYEGYLSKYDKEYKALSEEIKVLKKKAGEGNIVEKDYEKIKSSFENLLKKVHKDTKREK